MRDRNISEQTEQHGIEEEKRGTPTRQRSRGEHGEITNPEIDDDAMMERETNRSDLGAGE